MDIGGPQPLGDISKTSGALSVGNGLKLLVPKLFLVLGRLDLRQGSLTLNQVAMSADSADQVVESGLVGLPGCLE